VSWGYRTRQSLAADGATASFSSNLFLRGLIVITPNLREGNVGAIMSNGGYGGFHELLDALKSGGQ